MPAGAGLEWRRRKTKTTNQCDEIQRPFERTDKRNIIVDMVFALVLFHAFVNLTCRCHVVESASGIFARAAECQLGVCGGSCLQLSRSCRAVVAQMSRMLVISSCRLFAFGFPNSARGSWVTMVAPAYFLVLMGDAGGILVVVLFLSVVCGMRCGGNSGLTHAHAVNTR